MKKRLFAILLALLICCPTIFATALVEQPGSPEETPTSGLGVTIFENPNGGQGPMLYGSITCTDAGITKVWQLGATAITPYYSFDGETFLPVMGNNSDVNNWADDGRIELTNHALSTPIAEPYRSYYEGLVDRFLVKLVIEGGSYAGETEAFTYTRPSNDPLR